MDSVDPGFQANESSTFTKQEEPEGERGPYLATDKITVGDDTRDDVRFS